MHHILFFIKLWICSYMQSNSVMNLSVERVTAIILSTNSYYIAEYFQVKIALFQLLKITNHQEQHLAINVSSKYFRGNISRIANDLCNLCPYKTCYTVSIYCPSLVLSHTSCSLCTKRISWKCLVVYFPLFSVGDKSSYSWTNQ